jgi:hypothetical protein
VAELALDDVQRDAIVGELERVGVPELVGRKPWAWRSWWGANRRRTPAWTARR